MILEINKTPAAKVMLAALDAVNEQLVELGYDGSTSVVLEPVEGTGGSRVCVHFAMEVEELDGT